MVEKHFLSCGNRFLINIFFKKFKPSLKLAETHYIFWGKTLLPLAERGFLYIENCFLLFRASFLQVKTITETSWNK